MQNKLTNKPPTKRTTIQTTLNLKPNLNNTGRIQVYGLRGGRGWKFLGNFVFDHSADFKTC